MLFMATELQNFLVFFELFKANYAISNRIVKKYLAERNYIKLSHPVSVPAFTSIRGTTANLRVILFPLLSLLTPISASLPLNCTCYTDRKTADKANQTIIYYLCNKIQSSYELRFNFNVQLFLC